MFLQGLATSADVIGQMALLVLTGYLMVRKNWFSQGTMTDLTRFLIDAVIPCAIILSMIRSFSFDLLEESLILALISASWIMITWSAGWGWFKLFPGDSPSKDRAVTAMMMISNSLYLPLPVILAVTPAEFHDQAVVYIAMASLPSIIIMWTVGVKLMGGSTAVSGKDRLKRILNPPIVSVFLGILLSQIPGVRESARSEPGAVVPLTTIFQAMNYLSRLLSPMAMLILGGMIASAKSHSRIRLRYLIPLTVVRLILVPAAVFILIKLGITGIPALAATVLILVAAAPPATNHALIARRYNGEWELVASLQLITHVIALLTLPVWLSLGLGF